MSCETLPQPVDLAVLPPPPGQPLPDPGDVQLVHVPDEGQPPPGAGDGLEGLGVLQLLMRGR